jgi:flagellar biosynthesis regulator FlaF
MTEYNDDADPSAPSLAPRTYDADPTATVPTWRPEVESRERRYQRQVRDRRRQRRQRKTKMMTTTKLDAEITRKLDAELLAEKLLKRFMDDVLDAVKDLPEEEKPRYIKDALMQLDGALAARLRP